MTSPLDAALAARLLALADDEMILGHRDAEWTGHAPILEEDIAFANIAQDEIGHASLWYGLLRELRGDDPDRLVFFRETSEYRCAQLVELPKGDWAFSMLRQYLFDAAENARLPRLMESRHAGVAGAAAKIRPEEVYHLRHTSNWVLRLGLGTEASHQRMQSALDALWPYAGQLFLPTASEELLVTEGWVPDPAQVHTEWQQRVVPWLNESALTVPETNVVAAASRETHSAHLPELLAEMQEVARLAGPEVKW